MFQYLRFVRIVDEITEVVRSLFLHDVLNVVVHQVLPDVPPVLSWYSFPAQMFQLFLQTRRDSEYKAILHTFVPNKIGDIMLSGKQQVIILCFFPFFYPQVGVEPAG